MSVGVVLVNPKYPRNVAQAIRAASCFAVPNVIMSGNRVPLEGGKAFKLPREERMRGRYRVELDRAVKPVDEAVRRTRLEMLAREEASPYDSIIPVAVELVPGAEEMIWFEHPTNAVYVFGPEDGTLSTGILTACYRFVSLPMQHCANLSAAVYLTLYDRHAKRVREGLEAPLRLGHEVAR